MIKVVANPELHFNIAGGLTEKPEGLPIVLYSYRPGPHESFEFNTMGQLLVRPSTNLRGAASMCLNAEGGLLKGNKIILWPCSPEPTPNERWRYDESLHAVVSLENPELGFNVAGGALTGGTQVLVWSLE